MNLLIGFTGLFSLGQAGFMLIGAYTYSIFTMPTEVKLTESVYKYYEAAVKFDTGIFVGLLCAGLAAALFAALIGLPVLRLKSDYLAIATIGFAEIIRAIFQWDTLGPVTNGANVMREYLDLTDVKIPFTNIPFPPTLYVFIAAGICITLIVLLINSSYGRAFKAIRDDEVAAEAMGINLFKHKQMSFVISSFFAGISGALLAMYQYTVQAAQFKSAMTYELLLIVVIGGIGSVSGSCLASFLYIAASEWWLRGLDMGKFMGIESPDIFRSGFRRFVFSIIIMLIVLFFSKGLMGDKEISFAGLIRRFNKRAKTTAGGSKGGGIDA
jgi:branched-chain amino acid transport system permease protein